MKTRIPLAIRALPAAFLLLSAAPFPVQAASWIGGGVNNNWSTVQNWDSGASPFGTVVTFGDSGKTSRDAAGNTATTSGTINALKYLNFGTGSSDWQVTQINPGVTLTVNGAGTNNVFLLGGVAGDGTNASQTTRVAMTGSGSLVINKSSGTFAVFNGGNDATGPGYAELDLSELSSFTANLANFNVGTDGFSQGVVKLAATNTITSGTFRVARTQNRGAVAPELPSKVYLGHSNTLNVGHLYIAAEDFNTTTVPEKASGIMEFINKTDGSTLVLRGTNGGATRANMGVGYSAWGSASVSSVVAIADFRGGSIDAMLDTLIVGAGNNNGSTLSMTGSFSMDAGTVDAVNVTLGQSGTGGVGTAGYATGNLNIEGGTFVAQTLKLAHNEAGAQRVAGNLNVSGGSVTVAGGITMGSINTGTAAAIDATINLTGGSLAVGGAIAQGSGASAVTSTINLKGGTLDAGGNAVNVKSFNLESGTLKNLSEFNSGAVLAKETAGTLILAGTSNYTGATDIQAGRLLVNGLLAATSGVTVRDGATLGGSGGINAGATVAVQSGGVLAPGNSPGTLSVGTLDLQSGSTFSLELSGSEAGSGYDQVIASGGISLGGANLVLALGYAPVANQIFTLIQNNGGSPINGAFSTINGTAFGPGNTFDLSFDSVSYSFQLFYGAAALGGNDLVIQAVPEPGTGAMLLFSASLAAGVLFLRKSKRA